MCVCACVSMCMHVSVPNSFHQRVRRSTKAAAPPGPPLSTSPNAIMFIDIACVNFCIASLHSMPSPCKRPLQTVVKTQGCHLINRDQSMNQGVRSLSNIIENNLGPRSCRQGCRWTSGNSTMMPSPSLSSTDQ